MSEKKLTTEMLDKLNANSIQMQENGNSIEEIEAMGRDFFNRFAVEDVAKTKAVVEEDAATPADTVLASEDGSLESLNVTEEDTALLLKEGEGIDLDYFLSQAPKATNTDSKQEQPRDKYDPEYIAKEEQKLSDEFNRVKQLEKEVAKNGSPYEKDLIGLREGVESEMKTLSDSVSNEYSNILEQSSMQLQGSFKNTQDSLQEQVNLGNMSVDEANKELGVEQEFLAKKAKENAKQYLPELEKKLKERQSEIEANYNEKQKSLIEKQNIYEKQQYDKRTKEMGFFENLGYSLQNEWVKTKMMPIQVTQVASQLTPEDNESGFTLEIGGKDGIVSFNRKSPAERQVSNYKKLEELRKELEPTKQIIKSIRDEDYTGAASAAVGSTMNLVGSVVRAFITKSISMSGEMGEPMWASAVKAKAEETGKTPEQIIVEDSEDELTSMTLGGLAILSERFGMKGTQNLIKRKVLKKEISNEIKKKAPTIIGAAIKETGTELFQGGIEKANDKILKEGNSLYSKEGGKALINEMGKFLISEEGAETAVSTAVGSLLMLGGSKGAVAAYNNITTPSVDVSIPTINDIINDSNGAREGIDKLFKAGKITKEGYANAIGLIRNIERYNESLSDNNTNKAESIKLIFLRDKKKAELETLDESQRVGTQEEIDGINERLKEIATPKEETSGETETTEQQPTDVPSTRQDNEQEVEELRAKEQVELLEAIPNAENYLTDGKVDKEKITNPEDIAKFEEIYNNYDKLISPLLEAATTEESSVVEVQEVDISLDEISELESEVELEDREQEGYSPISKNKKVFSYKGKQYQISSIDTKKDGSRVVKAKEYKKNKDGTRSLGTQKRFTGSEAELIAKDFKLGIKSEASSPKRRKWKTKGTPDKNKKQEQKFTPQEKIKPEFEEDVPFDLDEVVSRSEADIKDFEESALLEIEAEEKKDRVNLIELGKRIFQVTEKSNGEYSVSQARETDGKLIPVKDKSTRSSAIKKFNKERNTKKNERINEAQKLINETIKQERDKIDKFLDDAIELTSGKGMLFDGLLGLPLAITNTSLKIIKAAYGATKNLSRAIQAGYEYAYSNGYNGGEAKYKKWVLGKLKTSKSKTDKEQPKTPVKQNKKIEPKTDNKNNVTESKEGIVKDKESNKSKPKSKPALKTELNKLLNPKSWRRKKTQSKSPSKQKLPKEVIDVLNEIKSTYTESVIKGMKLEEVNDLVSYVGNLIQDGKLNVKKAESQRRKILKIKELQLTEMIADKKNLKTKLNDRKEIIDALRSGKVILIDGVAFDSVKQFELIYDEDSVVSGEAIAVPNQPDIGKGTFMKSLNWRLARSFFDTDLMFRQFLPKGKIGNNAAKWLQKNIIGPMSAKFKGVHSDSQILEEKRRELKESSFGKRKITSTKKPRLSQKTGIKLTNNQGFTTPDLNVGTIVYLYNAFKQGLGANKFINAGYSIADMRAVVEFVNKNKDVKKYADGLVEIYKSYLPKVNEALLNNGYEGIGNIKTKTKEEIASIKIEERKKFAEEYYDVLSLIYGSESSIPKDESYSPISALGKDVESMQKASIFESDFNISAFAPNSFERTTKGSLNIRHSDAVFDGYVSGMTNMVHSISLLKTFQAVLSDKNIRLIKDQYGLKFADELQNSVNDVIYGRNASTKSSEKNYGGITDWLNQTNAAIMFFNFTSALTQPISFSNYAFQIDPELSVSKKSYFNNFKSMLSGSKEMRKAKEEFDSDKAFVYRLKKNLNAIETADLKKSEFGELTKTQHASKVSAEILARGYIMTTSMDSFAIGLGGIPYYAAKRDQLFAKYSKDNSISKADAYDMAKVEAMLITYQVANNSQQSSNSNKLSGDQKNVAVRLILSFNGVSMQYNRIIYNAASNIKNKRGNFSDNISTIAYYAIAQNVIFNAIKSLLDYIGDDDEDKKRKSSLGTKINRLVDGLIRGIGIYGVALSVVKNSLFDIYQYLVSTESIDQSSFSKDLSDILGIEFTKSTYGKVDKLVLRTIESISPPLGAKSRKVKNAIYSAGEADWFSATTSSLSVVTSTPIDRLQNISLSFSDELEGLEKLALLANLIKVYEAKKKIEKRSKGDPVPKTNSGSRELGSGSRELGSGSRGSGSGSRGSGSGNRGND